MESEAVHLRQPYELVCSSVQEAINVQSANAKTSTRNGRTVTFLRSTWVRFLGTKPRLKTQPKPVVPFTETGLR